MHWRDIRLRVRMACWFALGAFMLFFIALLFGIFSGSGAATLGVIFLFAPPLRLVQFLFGWETFFGWQMYVVGFIIAPLYYAVIGFFAGLLIENLKQRKEE